jgi:uncharacterized membrane protein
MAKNLVRAGSKVSPLGIVLDIAADGVVGGLESAGRNLDRRDLSNADKAGRVAFGSGKGVVKGVASTAGGAVIGAGIGALLGSVVPGPGTLAGAVVGAKVGALLGGIAVGPLTDKLVDKILPTRYEENVGRFADQTYKKVQNFGGNAAREASKASAAVKGALLGTVNMVNGWHF